MSGINKLILLVLFIFTSISWAQETTASGVITDTDGFIWTSAKITATFVPNPSFPNLNQYTLAGHNLATYQPYNSLLSQQVTTNASTGAFSITLLDNTQIQPSGSNWAFAAQSNTSAPASTYLPLQVFGSTFSLSSFLSTNLVLPRFPALPGTFAYGDIELTTVPNPGGTYFDTTTLLARQWNGTSWGNFGGNGSGVTSINTINGPFSFTGAVSCTIGNPSVCTFSGGTIYPGAGVAVSTGSAWATSLQVGLSANNLVQLNGSAQLPVLSATNLISIPAANLTGTASISTTGNAATATTATAATNLAGTSVNSAPYQGGSASTAYIAAPTTASHTFVFAWQPNGSSVAPTALDFTAFLASPPPIGATAPNAGTFTQVNLAGTGQPTWNGGANGIETWQVAAPTTGCGTTYPNGSIWHNLAGTASSSNRFYICDSATTTWNAKF